MSGTQKSEWAKIQSAPFSEVHGFLSYDYQEDYEPQHEENARRQTEKNRSAAPGICEITGHSRESSLDDYDEIDESQGKVLSHINSGFSKA